MSTRDLRAKAKAASERGAWSIDKSSNGWPFSIVAEDGQPVAHYIDRSDALFIAAATPQRVLALLDDLADLEAEVARLKARLEHAWDQGDETAQRRMAEFTRGLEARALVGDEPTRSEAAS